jgi:hypothetical protein
MRIAIGLLAAALALTGCIHHRTPTPASPPRPTPQTVIQPDLHPSGQVALVNVEARFVVISFPAGSVPPPGRDLKIYRNGLRVGEVKVCGPKLENDTVADIVSGDVQAHDLAREE